MDFVIFGRKTVMFSEMLESKLDYASHFSSLVPCYSIYLFSIGQVFCLQPIKKTEPVQLSHDQNEDAYPSI
jgi:hypothetical protein